MARFIVAALFGLLLWCVSAVPALAALEVLVSAKGELKDGKWIETVTLKNVSGRDIRRIVTSWPYNDKDFVDPNNPKGPRKDVATPGEPGAQFSQQRVVELAAGETKTIIFEYTGVDAKTWKSYYVDVYDGRIRAENMVGGAAEHYAFLDVPPGLGGFAVVSALQLPYPAALISSDLFGPMTFVTEITALELPPGWGLLDLEPDVHTISAGQVAIFEATFSTPFELVPGDVAFVDFDRVLQLPDGEVRWSSSLGIQVTPEPSSLLLLGAGALALVARIVRARTRVR